METYFLISETASQGPEIGEEVTLFISLRYSLTLLSQVTLSPAPT